MSIQIGRLPMNDLTRLVYISRSTQLDQGENHIQEVNEQILLEAHAFNKINNITGILCFGNGCYFQVIEGSKNVVELLYAKIEKDPRHKDIKLMFKEPITALSFAEWRMKFVNEINITMPLINLHGHKHFNPFEFAENLCKDLIDFLSQKCAGGKC